MPHQTPIKIHHPLFIANPPIITFIIRISDLNLEIGEEFFFLLFGHSFWKNSLSWNYGPDIHQNKMDKHFYISPFVGCQSSSQELVPNLSELELL